MGLAGVRVNYFTCDVTLSEAVTKVIKQINEEKYENEKQCRKSILNNDYQITLK
jgi:hypothetical protein